MQTNTTLTHVTIALDAADLPVWIAGGKAASLNRLITAGFPVPRGFVVSTQAYAAFVANNQLENAINAGDASGVKRGFDEGILPADIAESILRAYRQLSDNGHMPVAVRSSATAEDLVEASFAGQQDTYLNVLGEPALMRSLRRCWASLWNERAVAYRRERGIDPTNISIAVVVQEMIRADAAGVLFTLNPVSHDQDEVVINATWGLGDALVNGHVTPDWITVDKHSYQLKSQTVGDKAVMSV